MKTKTNAKTLSPELLRNIDAYWRATNYLSVGQIYLYNNPLLKKPLNLAHIKPRLLGHWGTTPEQSLAQPVCRGSAGTSRFRRDWTVCARSRTPPRG